MAEEIEYDAIVDHRIGSNISSQPLTDPFMGDLFGSIFSNHKKRQINSMWEKEDLEDQVIFRIPALGCVLEDVAVTHSGDILAVDINPSTKPWEAHGLLAGIGRVLHQIDCGGIIDGKNIVVRLHVGFVFIHLAKKADASPRKIKVSGASIKIDQ